MPARLAHNRSEGGEEDDEPSDGGPGHVEAEAHAEQPEPDGDAEQLQHAVMVRTSSRGAHILPNPETPEL